MKTNKLRIMNDFKKLAEDSGWSYNISEAPNDGQVCVELEKYSPQDQDFIVIVWFETDNECDFADKLEDYWRDFDPSEEAVKWVGPDGHGTNRAPYDLQDIINDMVDCKEMLRELVVAFHNHAYPDKKFEGHINGLMCRKEDYDATGDEMRDIDNILASIENARTYASGLYNNPVRWEIDEMLERFKNQVRDKLEKAYTNR